MTATAVLCSVAIGDGCVQDKRELITGTRVAPPTCRCSAGEQRRYMGVLLLAKIDAMALPDKTDGEEVLLSAASAATLLTYNRITRWCCSPREWT